jgi:hypothetical protein
MSLTIAAPFAERHQKNVNDMVNMADADLSHLDPSHSLIGGGHSWNKGSVILTAPLLVSNARSKVTLLRRFYNINYG